MINTTNTINQVLTKESLKRLVPSVYQSSAKDGLSSRYTFIPTSVIIDEMENNGWLPVKAQESRVRDSSNKGYQKHMIRFRNFHEKVQDKLQVGDTFIELVLTNSHNGLSSFVFNCGLYRLACSNGMVVSERDFNSAHIRHNSYDAQHVLNICKGTINKTPQIIEGVNTMKAIELSDYEKLAFANSAKVLRFGNSQEIDTERLLLPKRTSDQGNDLWKTMNVVQENLIKGGVKYDRFNSAGRYSGQRTTREIKAIDGGIKLNQALWTLALEMAKIKTSKK